MTLYLSMLKKDIKEFMMNSQYQKLVELQSNARMREFKFELQVSETEVDTQRRDRRPVQS